jgi:hypothetical protein
MAIAIAQSATQIDISASSSTAPSITLTGVTAGNALVMVAAIFDAASNTLAISSVTDGADSFTARTGTATTANPDRGVGLVGHAVNVSAGSKTVAANLSGTSGGAARYYALGLLELSGVATSAAEDDFAANSEINITSLDISAGGAGFTTTDPGSIIIGTAATNSADDTLNFASPASWTNRYRQNQGLTVTGFDSGTWLPGSIQTDYTAQWAHDNTASSATGCGIVVALKPGSGQAATVTPFVAPGAHPALSDPGLGSRELLDVKAWI